jgi:tetratricopeptide (TPR) repeat protein
VQIRSHRAIALDYLKRRGAALREHRAVALYERKTGDLRGYAKSLNNIGLVHMSDRRWGAALRCFTASCSLKEQLGDARGIAQSLHNAGKTYYLKGDLRSAEESFLASLRLRIGSARDKHGAAQSYVALATTALDSGRRADARHYATLALKAHRSYGDARGEAQAQATIRNLTTKGKARRI